MHVLRSEILLLEGGSQFCFYRFVAKAAGLDVDSWCWLAGCLWTVLGKLWFIQCLVYIVSAWDFLNCFATLSADCFSVFDFWFFLYCSYTQKCLQGELFLESAFLGCVCSNCWNVPSSFCFSFNYERHFIAGPPTSSPPPLPKRKELKKMKDNWSVSDECRLISCVQWNE